MQTALLAILVAYVPLSWLVAVAVTRHVRRQRVELIGRMEALQRLLQHAIDLAEGRGP